MEGGIMADLRASGLGGVPKGATADRPASPSIGDVFYNGTLGCLEIYTAQGWVANSAPPGIPDIGSATYSATNQPYNNASATVSFSPSQGGGLPNSYRATSSPGGYSGASTTSPITVSGLQSGIAYTFSVTGTNNFGTSAASVSSNSITANTVPDKPGTPVATYASNTSITLTFTPGANGGSSITNYKWSTDGVTYNTFSPAQTTSPLTVSGLTPSTTYSFYIKAVNANGDSVASSISNSITTSVTLSGGSLYSDSTYYYRAFTGNTNLTVANGSVSVDILSIAGGGGGGFNTGGGGGAGGVVALSSQTISPTTYTITVGGGGSGSLVSTVNATNGNPSQFGSLTPSSVGGGGGASNNSGSGGNNGGSGGGGGGTGGPVTPGGSPTSGQGYAGGSSNNQSPAYGSGGGGGAGGAGASGTSSTGGNGGAGINSYSGATWISNAVAAAASSSVTLGVSGYFAGGGGGGAYGAGTAGSGGSGGGGNSSISTNGSNATINTGSGGGGAGQFANGGNGAAGIVIIRYLKSAAQ
jgi:hypothetical protein